MFNIYDANENQVGSIGDDGMFYDINQLQVGNVDENGNIYNREGEKKAYIDETWNIYSNDCERLGYFERNDLYTNACDIVAQIDGSYLCDKEGNKMIRFDTDNPSMVMKVAAIIAFNLFERK
jgi:hypothetical protein